MDATIKIFTDYMRDIYAPSTCAAVCDAGTPASLGPIAYEVRRCCKSACSDNAVKDEATCKSFFCEVQCRMEVLIAASPEATEKCMQVCASGCAKRFINTP